MRKSTYLNIGGVPEHYNIPWKKSIDEGIFAVQNIELRWHDYRGGTGDLIQSLQNQDLDIAIMLTEGAVKSIADGNDFKIIQIYVNSPLYWGIYAHHTSSYHSLDEIKHPHFCISRFNSGSHLMAYLLAENRAWNLKDENDFSVIGNFVGALNHMQQHPNHLFLWERFMTKPSVDSGVLKKLGEIATPWPSFCIVVKNSFLISDQSLILDILNTISDYTYKFKQNTEQSIEYISTYFDFGVNDMKQWLMDTEWNYFLDPPKAKVEKVIDFLVKRQLIDEPKNREIFTWDMK